MAAKRLTSSLFLVVFLGFGIFAGIFLFRDYQALEVAQAEEAKLRKHLDSMKAETRMKEVLLERLENDPDYVESLIRTRLGYAKTGELIFRFE